MLLALKRCLLVCVVSFGLSVSSQAEVSLGASIKSSSPDGRIVCVGGAIVNHTADVLSWYYDWGDGSESSHYFPVFHHFKEPGEYSITVKGVGSDGSTAETSFNHQVPSLPETEVKQVVLSHSLFGLRPGESASCEIAAFDANGAVLSLEGKEVEFYFESNPVCVECIVDGVNFHVTGAFADDDQRGSRFARVWVYVDKRRSENPLHILVNRYDGEFEAVGGVNSRYYLPKVFYDSSAVTRENWALLLDRMQQDYQKAVCSNGPVFIGVSYKPSAYGISGNPVILGDAATPREGFEPFGVESIEPAPNQPRGAPHACPHTEARSLPVRDKHAGPAQRATLDLCLTATAAMGDRQVPGIWGVTVVVQVPGRTTRDELSVPWCSTPPLYRSASVHFSVIEPFYKGCHQHGGGGEVLGAWADGARGEEERRGVTGRSASHSVTHN